MPPSSPKLGLAGALLATPWLLTACAPAVQLAPTPEVRSTQWRGAPAVASAPRPDNLGRSLASPPLTALTERALAANADVDIARARVAQARARLRVARASLFPAVSAGGQVSLNRASGADASANLGLDYEIDLSGRVAAGRRGAEAQLVASQFDREAAALTVETELARAFVQYAAIAERLRFAEANLASSRELKRIIDVRFRLGAATRVDTGLQDVEVNRLERGRLTLLQASEQTRNAIAVLVGAEAPDFQLAPSSLGELRPPEFVLEQPAALLARRPDVRAAEARIAAARGDVDQARAAFWPQLRLSLAAAVPAASDGGLGAVLAIGPALLDAIFHRGQRQGELDLAAATQEETVAAYRRTLLVALRETEDALTAAERARASERLSAQAVETARETTRLARLRYLQGDADLQVVSDAEGGLNDAQDSLAITRQERLEALIDLYRAMGGAPAAEAG